ncbi:efflux transporter outer membrane subunit [Variovorax ginsengisoli]|uniref:NodT family efflux transporter outer membrane factor (OMF) lipoprotein n=1 Tax=Variovorax ginsengisoli TaxID=363844 RepID=A0ABT9SDR2_9BURK|nr:efflux transporter outer membrane subunit [Variovorax ginsengisoli]MDP9902498.1 NodT family efflux transporter outer membrane factor (OMF) lipoprotein [Variovorax ginsengisoli]
MSPLQLLGALGVPFALTALGACSIARPPAIATAPMPAQWNAPLPATAGIARPATHTGSLAALTEWWRQLDDPLLVDLIAAAQDASPTMASAAARIAEARSNRVATASALLPSLNGTLSGTRANTPSSGGNGFAATPITTLQGTVQSQWEIDLFGRLGADRDAAETRLASADAKWHDARVSVAADTANAYFAQRTCVQQLAVSESDARSRSETSRLTDLSARAGFTAPADAALARASASDASGRLTQQRAQCEVQRKSLVALTGLDERELAARLSAMPTLQPLPALLAVDAVPAALLAQRPDVYASELDVAAASADVGSAEAERYPRLSLTGSVGVSQYRVGGFRQSLDTWSVGPLSLTVPLLDGGARKANADASRARYAEAVAAYRSNVRQAVSEVEQALVNLQSTDARAGDADAAVQNYQASFNATQARYDSGLASLFELEDARRTLYSAQTARVSLQRERAEAWVALYRATGGGWTRPAQQEGIESTASTSTSSVTPASQAVQQVTQQP